MWLHLSSSTGDLPAPGRSTQQCAAVIGNLARDPTNGFVIGMRQAAPSLVWFRRVGQEWTRVVLDPEYLPIEAGGALYDVDGDGDLDIVMGGDWQSNEVWWWENPYPHFDPDTPWRRRRIKASGATQHHDQIFGDFDGDGRAELVFWNQGARQLLWAPIPSDPRVEPWPATVLLEAAGEGLAQGDVDGDGQVELLAGGRWLKYTGNGRFAAYAIDPAQTHPRMAVGDLNGDGRLEVVMVPGDGIGRLKWYARTGDPRDPDAWTGHDLLGADVVHGHTLAVADLSGDGHLDIFCAEMARWTEGRPEPDNPQAHMWVFRGDGRGGFTKTEVAVGVGNHESRVGDLDGDGRLDILGKPYCWETPRVDLWLNRPAR